MAKHSANILEWARQGAEARWHQLQTELASLVETFPHLATLSQGGRRGRRTSAAGGTGSAGRKGHAASPATGAAPRRKRPQMSAAQKKAVSLRMKKYWADRRKTAKA
jgi:hypothetical protein